jgi:hypothetical protein
MATVRVNGTELRRALNSPQGPAVRALRRASAQVESEAKRRCPVDTGRLRASIHTELFTRGGDWIAKVGTNVHYGRYVEQGTGLYGPRHRVIRPVRARVLRWVPRGSNKAVFARSVRGVRPRPYLVPALKAVFPGRVTETPNA